MLSFFSYLVMILAVTITIAIIVIPIYPILNKHLYHQEIFAILIIGILSLMSGIFAIVFSWSNLCTGEFLMGMSLIWLFIIIFAKCMQIHQVARG